MLYLQLHYHFKVQILGPKNGSRAAESPSASQGGWVFSIAILHHCGRDLEGQVRDRPCLHQFSPCKFNPNCDHDHSCSRRRSPPPPTSTPSWTSSCGTFERTSSGSPGFPGSRSIWHCSSVSSATPSAATISESEVGQGCGEETRLLSTLLLSARWQGLQR